MYISTM